MEGIYFGKTLLEIYFCAIVIYYFKRDDYKMAINDDSGFENSDKEAGIKRTIKSIAAIIVVVYLMYIGITKKQTTVDILILGMIAIIILITMLYSITEFIKYIFIRSDTYQFDSNKEHTFSFTAIICFMACSFIEKTSLNTDLLMSDILRDFVKMITCSYWYFCVIFFPVSLLLIIGHKRTLYKQKPYNDNKDEKICINDFKLKRSTVKEDYEMVCDSNKFKCIVLKLYDGVVSCLIDGIEFLIKLILVVISIPYSVIVTITRWTKRKLSADLGKSLIMCSRFSLAGGLIIVFLIDKYYSLFSGAGSSVFEFCCSVIIIPLLITQLAELRNKA